MVTKRNIPMSPDASGGQFQSDPNAALTDERAQPSGDETMSPLARAIFDTGDVSMDAFDAAAREARVTGETVGQILVRDSFISYRRLIEIVSEVEPQRMSAIAGHAPVVHVPARVLRDLHACVIAEASSQEDDAPVLFAATSNSETVVRRAFRYWYPHHEVRFVKARPDQIDEAIDAVEARELEEEGESEEFGQGSGRRRIFDWLLRTALNQGASDIHIEPRQESYVVLFRVLGKRRIEHVGPPDEYDRLVAMIKDRAGCDQAEHRQPQDGSFTINHLGRPIDFRVATVPVLQGEKVVIRVLDPAAVAVNLNDLGITHIESWRRGADRNDGLCFICGPTGSGKTTTLNATIRRIDRFGKAVFTAEEPVEFAIPYVSQAGVNRALGYDFAASIRNFMRADPDVISVGEVRDLETAENCIKAAETGHMVFATLHASDVASAITRMRDIGVQPNDFKHMLRTILVQRLVRTLCQTCDGAGCPDCNHERYSSRTIVSECVEIRDGEDVDRILNGEQWWTKLVDDAIGKMEEGLTDIAELKREFGTTAVDALRARGYEVSDV